MKTKALLTTLLLGLLATVFGQRQTLDLTFTAIDNTVYVQLDSIKVKNRTQGGDTTLFWPDTTLTLGITPGDLLLYIGYITGYPIGVFDINHEKNKFQLYQNFPNPVKDQCNVTLYVPEKGIVNVVVSDIQGRMVINNYWQFDKGLHSFLFTPGHGNLFFLSARWNGIIRSVKILAEGDNSEKNCTLDCTGDVARKPGLKASFYSGNLIMKESGILDTPENNETYTFQFATNIPCPGTPTVIYEGQVYNTIQIFSQCWLKENMNVGSMIDSNQNMYDNGVIEKYCYKNEEDSCTKYGGLYQWNEMMQYSSQQGTRGICPHGWHLPTDEEWKILEGTADSQYGIGDKTWGEYPYRGFDAAKNLKTTNGWFMGGNGTDLFGFAGLPGGGHHVYGNFVGLHKSGIWWTSTERNNINAEYRIMDYIYPVVTKMYDYKEFGHSVRCLRDY